MKNFLKLLMEFKGVVERLNSESLLGEDHVSDIRQEEDLTDEAEDLIEELDTRIGQLTADSQELLDLIEEFQNNQDEEDEE